jgi:hypothetical protein
MPATPPTMAYNSVQRRSFIAFLSSAATQSSTKSRGISDGFSKPRTFAPPPTPAAISLSLTFSSPSRFHCTRQASFSLTVRPSIVQTLTAPEAGRQPRRVVATADITRRARHAGTAAAASLLAIPRSIVVRLADPAGVPAAAAGHPSARTTSRLRRCSSSSNAAMAAASAARSSAALTIPRNSARLRRIETRVVGRGLARRGGAGVVASHGSLPGAAAGVAGRACGFQRADTFQSSKVTSEAHERRSGIRQDLGRGTSNRRQAVRSIKSPFAPHRSQRAVAGNIKRWSHGSASSCRSSGFRSSRWRYDA